MSQVVDTSPVEAAHDAVAATIQAMPEAALTWRREGDDWAPQQLIGHLASANDFYVMVVEEARRTAFGVVRIHTDLPGWQRMRATDRAVAEAGGVAAALAEFERSYARALAVLRGITPEELDRSFTIDFDQPDAESGATTLRRRVVDQMASHLHDHHAQLAAMLDGWRAAHEREPRPEHASIDATPPV